MKNIFLIGSVLFTLMGASALAHQVDQPLLAHLSFSRLPVHAHLSWEKPPSLHEYATLRLEFRKASDHTLTDIAADVSVEVTMPEMDHGNVPTEIEPSEVGVLRVKNVSLFMNGTWQIAVTIILPEGSQETQAFTYEMGDGGDEDHHHGHQH